MKVLILLMSLFVTTSIFAQNIDATNTAQPFEFPTTDNISHNTPEPPVTHATKPKDDTPVDSTPAEGEPQSIKNNLCGSDRICNIFGIIAVILYVTLLLVARRFWVIEPNNARLRAHAKAIKAALEAEKSYLEADKHDRAKAVSLQLEYAEELIGARKGGPHWIFAFTGRQLAAWRTLHDAERQLDRITRFAGDVARGQAMAAIARLKHLPGASPLLRAHLREVIEATKEETDETVVATRLRPLLQEAKAEIYASEDTTFESMADAKNKSYWLIWTALFSVVTIGVLAAQSIALLLFGAIGGLLARLRKAIKQKTTILDFGISWGVLFLTPLVGALTGWIGVFFIDTLQTVKILSDVFQGINVFIVDKYTLTIAFVFGFSATLFDVFFERFENELETKAAQSSQDEDAVVKLPKTEDTQQTNNDGKKG